MGLQLRECERLQQAMINADIESAHPILNRVFGRENQHGRLDPVLSQRGEDLNPNHIVAA
jgi:hypothetical protein